MKHLFTFLIITLAGVRGADLATTLGLTGPSAITGITAEADDDLLTKTNHGLVTGRFIDLTAITGGTGLTQGNDYYVYRVSSSTFKLCSSITNAYAGTGVDITADGTSITVTKPGDTIAIGGDSGTSEHKWPHYFIAWLQLTYPELDLNTYEAARSGTQLGGWNTTDGNAPPTAPETSEFEKRLLPFNPDLVVLMLGYNRPTGQTAAQHGAEYEDFYTNWIDNTGRKLLTMGMYPSQDATDVKDAGPRSDAEATFAAGHDDVWAASQFAEHGVRWMANDDNAIDLVQLGATFAPGDTDGHYGPAGHVVVAWALLTNLGVDTLVSSATLAANTNTVTASDHCTISNMALTASGGTFERLDARLPWAIDEEGRANATALIAELAGWQDYSITITGLSADTYTIACDGVVIGSATHTELAAGWNMADLTSGPVWDQCQATLDAIRTLQGCNVDTGVNLGGSFNANTIGDVIDYAGVYYTTGAQRGATYLTSIATQGTGGGPVGRTASNMAALHAAAQPETRTYTITAQSSATITPRTATRRKGGTVTP